MGRTFDLDMVLEQIDPQYRDEARAILTAEKTDGPVGRCLSRNVDRYAMAAWDRGLAHAVTVVRPYWAHGLQSMLLVMMAC